MPITPIIIDQNDFSTETGYLRPGESDFRSEICLNGKWDFQPVDLPAGFVLGESIPEIPLPQPDQWDDVKLKVPSPWNINGFLDGDGIPGGDFVCYPSYPESWKRVKMGWMRRTLHVPEGWAGKRILLHFEAVCGHCQVYIDGVKVGEHFDNSLPQTYSINDFVTPGKEHELWVGVRAAELFSINENVQEMPYHNGTKKLTYPTGSFFNMNTSGIWQDVYLLGIPQVRITDVFVQPDLSTDQLRVQVSVKNQSAAPAHLILHGIVKALKPFSFPDDGIAVLPHYDLEDEPTLEFPAKEITVAAHEEVILTLETVVSGKLLPWGTENPNLYATLITLAQDGKNLDRKYTRFGWREFKIRDGNLYLNGSKIQVKSDSWHFMGIPQMTRRYAFAWYKSLKDAGGNGVRLHAMPYPTFYLEVADEMGICVLDESAIWASHSQYNYDEPITWDRFYTHVRSLVLRDRNYASVMGWSVENEIRMEIDTPFLTDEVYAMVKERVCKLRDIVSELDPTRNWISGDGSFDWDGEFPVSMLHYVNPENYQKMKQEAKKPVGVGECTIGYFGTPKHAAEFAGDRAFESVEERMKGVAIESYGQLKAQLLAGFSYLSVFNLAWYSLKPLPLGHAHQENAPTIENGVYFGEYQEGKPGVQPERLGPYCTTFNPGYDSDLPLYDPWSMYEAIKAVYSFLPSPYDAERKSPPRKSLPVMDEPAPVAFFGEKGSVHYEGLKAAGVQFAEKGSSRLIYADLSSISMMQKWRLKRKLKALQKQGGTLFLSGVIPASQRFLEKLLGERIEIFEREASSLVFAGEYANTDLLVDYFRLQELYFAEDDDTVIQRYGIRCDGKALLRACGCDWQLWNHRAETSKTGAVYRSEKESPEAPALVKLEIGKARILLSSIEMRENRVLSERNRKSLWHKLMKAAGAKIDENFGKDARFNTYTPAREILQNSQATKVVRGFIPMVGMLTDDMIAEIGSFSIRELAKMHGRLLMLSSKKLDRIDEALGEIPLEGSGERQMSRDGQILRVLATKFFSEGDPQTLLDEDFLAGEDVIWQVRDAEMDGFHFRDMPVNYMSFQLNSPRGLDDLLIEPNQPKLYLNLETACALRVWLNGQEIFSQKMISKEAIELQTPLLLEKGSNHVLIKVVNVETDNIIKLHLSSSHDDFIQTLECVATMKN